MKPGRIPMGGMNMNALMKQAQKMQDNIKKLQEELENREYTATSGGGAVTAVVKSKQVKSLTISPTPRTQRCSPTSFSPLSTRLSKRLRTHTQPRWAKSRAAWAVFSKP